MSSSNSNSNSAWNYFGDGIRTFGPLWNLDNLGSPAWRYRPLLHAYLHAFGLPGWLAWRGLWAESWQDEVGHKPQRQRAEEVLARNDAEEFARLEWTAEWVAGLRRSLEQAQQRVTEMERCARVTAQDLQRVLR